MLWNGSLWNKSFQRGCDSQNVSLSCNILLLQHTNFPVYVTLKEFWFWFWLRFCVVWGCNHMFWPPWRQSRALFLWADVCLSVCLPVCLSVGQPSTLVQTDTSQQLLGVLCAQMSATMGFTFVVFGEISHDMAFCLVIRNLEVIVVLDTIRTLSLTTHQIQQPGQKSSVLSYHLKLSSGAGV